MAANPWLKHALEAKERFEQPTGGTVVAATRVPKEVRQVFEYIARREHKTVAAVLREVMFEHLERMAEEEGLPLEEERTQ